MAVDLLASAEELRRWVGLDPGDVAALSDESATLLLEGVSGQVIRYVTRNPEATTLLAGEEPTTVDLDGNGSYELLLPGAPVLAVASVVEDPDTLETTLHDTELDVTGYIEWSRHGILRRLDGGVFVRRFRWYRVAFRFGYEAVPEDVRNLVLRVAARAFGNPEGLATEAVGGYSAGFAFDDTRLPTLSAPDRRELDAFRL